MATGAPMPPNDVSNEPSEFNRTTAASEPAEPSDVDPTTNNAGGACSCTLLKNELLFVPATWLVTARPA